MSTGTIRVALRGRLGTFSLDAGFEVPARGITAIFGPSGCGKTSILRGIAGLLRLPDAECIIDGEIWQKGPAFRAPHRRAVGYVFQEASLFAHLDARRNLLYGAPRFGSAAGRADTFAEVTDLLGLTDLLDRGPDTLSGGERQRVAIGRALLSEPHILLMDEPLSALDRRTKDEILPFLERLHETLALPILYVSHDMSEVERLADQLVLMERGRIIAAGPLPALQSDPGLPLAAQRDAAVSLEAHVTGYDPADGLLRLRIDGGDILMPAEPMSQKHNRRLRIAASDVSLAREPPVASTILNILPARIVSMQAVSQGEIVVIVALGREGGGARLLSRISRRSREILHLEDGCLVYAQVKAIALPAKA